MFKHQNIFRTGISGNSVSDWGHGIIGKADRIDGKQ